MTKETIAGIISYVFIVITIIILLLQITSVIDMSYGVMELLKAFGASIILVIFYLSRDTISERKKYLREHNPKFFKILNILFTIIVISVIFVLIFSLIEGLTMA